MPRHQYGLEPGTVPESNPGRCHPLGIQWLNPLLLWSLERAKWPCFRTLYYLVKLQKCHPFVLWDPASPYKERKLILPFIISHGAKLKHFKTRNKKHSKKKKLVLPGFSALILNSSFRGANSQVRHMETPWFVNTYARRKVFGKPRINPSAVFCREIFWASQILFCLCFEGCMYKASMHVQGFYLPPMCWNVTGNKMKKPHG